jgi:hypothetical protein
MGLLDNVEEQLKEIQLVKDSLREYKKLKLKNIKSIQEQEKKYKKQKHVRLGHNFYKKIKKVRNINNRKERDRCPKSYNLYITSKWWEKRKNKYYKTHKRVCNACNSTEHIILHHIVYGKYGKEPDNNLVPLCRKCHTEFHKTYILKKNMRKSTNNFILSKKATT